MTKVAINGFGRIGRLVARAILERPDCGLELVSVNDLADAKANAWLFKHDSVHGRFPGTVEAAGDAIIVNGKRIQVTAEKDPSNLPHAANGVELALECTGFFTDRDSAQKHIDAGAKRVLISAPAKGVDLTVVYGVNEDKLTAEHTIVSNASCTTNCLAPVAKVLNDALGIERGLMTTVHAYTNDQKILDQIHSDLRRARAAAMNMIPTTTGAARAVGEVLPELKGKLDGSAIRVPVPDVSLIDLTFTPGRDTSRDEVNAILKAASETPRLKGILDYTDEPLVSIDLQHTSASSTVDSLETAVIEGKLVRVLSWYDNEWGFSNRMVDTAAAMAKLGKRRGVLPELPATNGRSARWRCSTGRSLTKARELPAISAARARLGRTGRTESSCSKPATGRQRPPSAAPASPGPNGGAICWSKGSTCRSSPARGSGSGSRRWSRSPRNALRANGWRRCIRGFAQRSLRTGGPAPGPGSFAAAKSRLAMKFGSSRHELQDS
jgi:glyceraldehyde 3-phosphate dehydrogenase